MQFADVKRLIDLYLKFDQPDINLALKEIRAWLQAKQRTNEIHSYMVRRSSDTIILDVQTTPTSNIHTLNFVESSWLNNTPYLNSPVTNPPPIKRPKPDVGKDGFKRDTSDDAYDRAMRGL
jgi:hypothetical protein